MGSTTSILAEARLGPMLRWTRVPLWPPFSRHTFYCGTIALTIGTAASAIVALALALSGASVLTRTVSCGASLA